MTPGRRRLSCCLRIVEIRNEPRDVAVGVQRPGLADGPEVSLRVNRIIFVSANFSEDLESFNASHRECV